MYRTLMVASAGVALAGAMQFDTTPQQLNGATSIPAWESLPGSMFHNFPPRGGQRPTVFVPKQTLIPRGNEFRAECPKSSGPCELTVFIYDCAPCVSQKQGAQDHLISEDFKRTRCAPTFTTGTTSGIQHRMTGYRRQLNPDEVYVLSFPYDLEYAVVTLTPEDAFECSDFTTSATCARTDTPCFWRGGRCIEDICVPTGPSLGGCPANICIARDLP